MVGTFSFLIIAQLGFVVLALGLFTPKSVTAAIFHLFQEIPVIASLFLFGATLTALPRGSTGGSQTSVWRHHPWFAAAFLFQILSLSGIPPFSGFWAKYVIIEAAIARDSPVIVAGTLAGSLLTLIVALRVWLSEFWSETDSTQTRQKQPAVRWRPMAWSAGGLMVLSLLLGLGAEGTWRIAESASTALLDHESPAGLVPPESPALP
jgi:multicomponent Na+:H+ antiporter subunit D